LRVVNEVLTTGTRILLCPGSPAVAREHGFALEADQFFAGPPGRGHLARGRTADLIQFAHHGEPS
jgi:S-DNA-T family DNA segregation ATPase FtsK/SpoIIIE